nr:zinc finger protein [Haemonchus contortus]
MKRPLEGIVKAPLLSCSGVAAAVRVTPRYAVLKLQPDSDCVALFQFALSQGICDISFVTSPYEFFTELRDSSASPRTSRLETVSPPLITPSTSHTSSSAQLPPTLTANNDQNSSSSETVPGGFSNPDDGQTASSRCASIESATPPPASMDHFNTVLSTLFGKGEPAKDVRIINGPPPKATSPPPEIPGPGQIKCRLCGITVSCKKIANLTAHALKIHTPVPLWKCPKRECEFDHADFTRVRSHIRTSHPELQGEIPRDNRNSVTVPEAQRYLAHCYPSIDWAHQYANIFPTVKKDSKEQSQTELRDPASEWYTVIDESNLNTPVQCSACRLMVALNKHSIEDHVKTMHSSGRPYQCGICKYTSVEEWKVRVHASIKHPETPCLQMLTLASHSKPYLYIRELFPDIAALLPEDEVDEMLYGFRQLNPSVLLSVPTSLNSLSENVADNTVVDSTSCFDLKPPKPPTQLTEETTPMLPDPFQTIFLELLNNQHTPLPVKPSPIRKNHNSLSVERFGSRVECAMCKAPVESKRTMLVGHAKSHCPQRQWQCPHCETTAAFHSKLKLHVQNAHKSDAEPMDMYSAELENKWLELFRQCFPQFAQQCFVEEWKFRSKQQQHLHSISADDWNPRGTDGGEQLRRTILIEPEEPRKEVEEKPENHHNTSSNGLQHHSIPSQPFCNNSASV